MLPYRYIYKKSVLRNLPPPPPLNSLPLLFANRKYLLIYIERRSKAKFDYKFYYSTINNNNNDSHTTTGRGQEMEMAGVNEEQQQNGRCLVVDKEKVKSDLQLLECSTAMPRQRKRELPLKNRTFADSFFFGRMRRISMSRE